MARLRLAGLVVSLLAACAPGAGKEHVVDGDRCVEARSGELGGSPTAGRCDVRRLDPVAGCYRPGGRVELALSATAATRLESECPRDQALYRAFRREGQPRLR